MKRTAASPIVCVATWKPARGEALDRAREPLRLGPERLHALAVRVRRLQPGGAAVDHAVGEELHDAAAPQPPAHVAQGELRLHLLVARLAASCHSGTRRRMRQLVRALEVAQQVVASPARRPSRARRSGRARSAAAARSTWRARSSGQRSRGAARRTRSCAPSRAARRSGRRRRRRPPSAVREVARPVDLRELERARRGERRVQVGEPHERGGAVDRLGDLRRSSARRRSPAPRRTASRAAACPRPAPRAPPRRPAVAEVDSAGELGAPERVQVGVHQPGDQRLRRRRAGPRCARRSARAPRPRRRRRRSSRRGRRRRSRRAAPDRASGRARRRSRGQRPSGT